MFREKATCARLQGPLSRVVTSSILGPLRQDNLLLAGPAPPKALLALDQES